MPVRRKDVIICLLPPFTTKEPAGTSWNLLPNFLRKGPSTMSPSLPRHKIIITMTKLPPYPSGAATFSPMVIGKCASPRDDGSVDTSIIIIFSYYSGRKQLLSSHCSILRMNIAVPASNHANHVASASNPGREEGGYFYRDVGRRKSVLSASS